MLAIVAIAVLGEAWPRSGNNDDDAFQLDWDIASWTEAELISIADRLHLMPVEVLTFHVQPSLVVGGFNLT
jgi:hypothetical protein